MNKKKEAFNLNLREKVVSKEIEELLSPVMALTFSFLFFYFFIGRIYLFYNMYGIWFTLFHTQVVLGIFCIFYWLLKRSFLWMLRIFHLSYSYGGYFSISSIIWIFISLLSSMLIFWLLYVSFFKFFVYLFIFILFFCFLGLWIIFLVLLLSKVKNFVDNNLGYLSYIQLLCLSFSYFMYIYYSLYLIYIIFIEWSQSQEALLIKDRIKDDRKYIKSIFIKTYKVLLKRFY